MKLLEEQVDGMKTLLEEPMGRNKKTDRAEESVVKMDKSLIELVKFIVASRNRERPSGEKLTMSQYLSDITRRTIVNDYNGEVKKSKPIRLEDLKEGAK